MDQEKPFKTIEVVDSRTNQVCKVACMSCIRGHRTTSCGIPVCRTKIFWTVKRPGRPSNSCTCRYGATGGCKCVVARSACPHKSKKGEKRSGECRCDEQGRYCCLLEPNHWNILLSLGKPTVDFFQTREALETKQAAAMQTSSYPSTPAYSVTSPVPSHRIPNTSGPNGHIQPIHIMPNSYNTYPRPSTTLTPRFGMMGIGAPQGTHQDPLPDVLKWEGQAPQAPRQFNSIYEGQPSDNGCCQAPTPTAPPLHAPPPVIDHTFPSSVSMPPAYNGVTHDMSMSCPISPQDPPAFDWNRLQTDYYNYQFPSAICQNCGLNGCTCKNCPPVFQNYGNGSWAQCCGRKHARDVQPSPAPVKIPRTETYDTIQRVRHRSHPQDPPAPIPQEGYTPDASFAFDNAFGLNLPPAHTNPDFPDFELDHELLLPDGTQPLDISEFLMSDLDRSREPGREQSPIANGSGAGAAESEAGEGGGGGCCCGGN